MPKLSELAAISALDEDDILVIVEDGTAKKVTVAELRAALGGMALITDSTLGVDGLFDTNTLLGGNIPATYKSLHLEMVLRTDASAVNDDVLLRLNNDSGGNYDTEWIYAKQGAGPSRFDAAAATSWDLNGIAGNTATAGLASGVVVEIPNYAGTTFWKHMLARGSGTIGASSLAIIESMGLWHSTAAITRIAVFPNTGTNFKAGSRFTLWGKR